MREPTGELGGGQVARAFDLNSESTRGPKGELGEGRLPGLLILTVSPREDQQESWERAGC